MSAACAVPGGAGSEGEKPSPNRLWYRQPAKEWVEALPLGNGRLGCMVFGRTAQERLQLNEDTLWAGAGMAAGTGTRCAIASGALLVACATDHTQEILHCWRLHGFPGAVIGQATQAEDGLIAQRDGKPVSFPNFAVDEITKLWPST